MTPDIEDIFERALKEGRLKVVFPNKQAAIRWRLEASKQRFKARKASVALGGSEDPALRAQAGTTPYDNLALTLAGDLQNEIHLVPKIQPSSVESFDE